MEFILSNKWIFLILAETIFWICAIAFLILRYWFKFNKLSKLFIIIFIINDLWIAFLAFMDYQKTGEFSGYQITIVVIIVYAMTLGKSDFKKLDYFVKRLVAEMKGEPFNNLDRPKQYYGYAYALVEWKQFTIHLIVFLLVHAGFYIAFGFSNILSKIAISELFDLWITKDNSILPFKNEKVNNFSRVWLLVLLIDFAITVSYSIFPKRKPAK